MSSRTYAGRLAVFLLVISVSGCAWLRPSVTASEVRLITGEMLQGCARVGTTHVAVVDKLDQLLQNEAQLAEELVALARNSAVQFGGNSIMAITNMSEGTQSFAIFRCDPDAGSGS